MSDDDHAKLEDLIPTSGWLGDWHTFCRGTMMAPPSYQMACGLAAISAAVGRGVWFRLGGNKRWHPHLWAVLYGPAGWQKSTPIHTASDLVFEARGSDALLPRRFSREAAYDAIAAMPDGFWDIGELSAFLHTSRSDYMAGIRDDLSDLWDSPTVWKRKLRTELIEINRPALTAIATARPDLFEAAAGLSDFSSGFLSRFLLFEPPDDAEPPYVGDDTAEGIQEPVTRALWSSLVYGLKDVAAWHGGDHRVQFTDDAKEIIATIDRRWLKEARDVDPALSGWATRRGMQARKIAILRAFSERGRPEVAPEDMAWAVAVVDACWNIAAHIALEKVGLDRDGQRRARVWETARALIAKQGGTATLRDITKHTWRSVRDPRELHALAEQWEAAGLIEIGLRGGTRGPKSKALRLLNGTAPPEGWTTEVEA